MKKIAALCVLMSILLCGCTTQNTERLVITDEIATVPRGSIKYRIHVSVPQDVTECVSAMQDDARLFEAADGTYYIVTEVLPNCTAGEAIQRMTGESAEALGAMCTKNMSMPEYRFSWCMEGENGMYACTGIVVEDEAYCYTLEFCAQEAYTKQCAEVRRQVLSGFGLYADEGF